MSRTNGTRLETAFTASIEAREGVTTGISAADRARTISVAIDAAKGPEHIVSPGHVFPLVARDGGVLVRAGHTEAAVDVARLAGLNPVGRDLRDHARGRHDGADGRSVRLRPAPRPQDRHDPRPHRLSAAARTGWSSRPPRRASKAAGAATWTARTFLNKATGVEQIALVKGHVDPGKPTLVRMHALGLVRRRLRRGGRARRPARRRDEGDRERRRRRDRRASTGRCPTRCRRRCSVRAGEARAARQRAIARLWRRRADPRRARRPRHDPADQQPPHAGRARRLRPRHRRRAADPAAEA